MSRVSIVSSPRSLACFLSQIEHSRRFPAFDSFPDVPYFTMPRVQTLLTTILFLYSVLHPDVGYRQVSSLSHRSLLVAHL